jgi:hypothetical protein
MSNLFMAKDLQSRMVIRYHRAHTIGHPNSMIQTTKCTVAMFTS